MMESVTSQKGNRKIIKNGYIYVFKKHLANDIRSFECQLRRKGQCRATIKVDVTDVVVEEMHEHTHPPSDTKCEVQRVKSRIKDRCGTTNDTTQRILTDVLQGVSATAAVNLPKVEHMRRTIRSQRQAAENLLPEPINRETIPNLTFEQQQTSNGERFLIFDSGMGNADRMLIFATNQALQLLADSEDWFGDGTFKVCPEIYFQFYTIHARVGDRIFPCIYALLPNKQELTYNRLFNQVLEYIVPMGNGPSTMMLDFERGAISAAQNTFENVPISCCFFHFSSNIWKHVQQFGLQERYRNDQEFALHMRMFGALAFVPPDDVIESFTLLSDRIQMEYGDNINQIVDYIEDNYIGRIRRNAPPRPPTFPIELWNMFHRTYQEMPRTNNNIEGWHRRFEGNVTNAHPGFWKFLEALKREETLSRIEMLQQEGGHEPPLRRRRYIDCNNRILAIVDDYANRDRINYLRSIGHNIGF